MNEDRDADEAPLPVAVPSAPPPRRVAPGASRTFVVVLALLLGAAGVLAWLDAHRTLLTTRSEVAQKLTDADAALAQGRARQSELAAELRETQAKLALVEARLAESQSQQASLETLYRELTPSRDQLALMEVDQALSLASQQLAVAGNVPAALAALQLADAKLARVDRPRLAPLRRALAADMERLKAVPFVDIAGLASKLDGAIASVGALPLARDERLPAPAAQPPAADVPAWRRALQEAWDELRGLVRIEVSDRPAAPLLAPEQQYFLRENLRLRLLSARVGLLARNESAFRADVRAAEAWLKQYFDPRAKPVQSLAALLASMTGVAMPSEVPELTRSLDAARALSLGQEGRTEPQRPAR